MRRRARMRKGQFGRGWRDSRRLIVAGFGLGRRGKGRWVGLKHSVLLALGEVRAAGPAVIVVEEVVDQVGGKRDQVGEKEPGCEDTHHGGSLEAVESSESMSHRGSYSSVVSLKFV